MKNKYLYIIIFLLVLPILSCYISTGDENKIMDSAKITLRLPEDISKAAAMDYEILDVVIVNINYEEALGEVSSLSEIKDYLYFNTFNLGTPIFAGDPLTLTVNDLKVDDNYFVIAFLYDEFSPEIGTTFVTFEPFSVVENKTITVVLYEFSKEPPIEA